MRRVIGALAGGLLAAVCASLPSGAQSPAPELPRHDREARRAELRALVREAAAPRAGAASARSARSAQAPRCGELVTEDLRLREDLLCEPLELALRVGSGVTVDFGGHLVRGAIVACGGEEPSPCDVGTEEVTLKRGTLEGHVSFDTCDRCVIDRLTVRGTTGFGVELGAENLVVRSRFEGNTVALSSFFSSGGNVVILSHFRDNAAGVVVGDTDGNVIWRNTFRDNGTGVTIWDEDLFSSSDNRVARNHFLGNVVGAHLEARNQAKRNLFARNLFWGNEGAGLLLETHCVRFMTETCGGHGSRVEKNVFLGNGSDPLEREIRDFSSQEVLETLLLDDGITVPASLPGRGGLTVLRNRALFNADLGIEAPGVVDGGGNRAVGNGDPRQCVGVDCRGPGRGHARGLGRGKGRGKGRGRR